MLFSEDDESLCVHDKVTTSRHRFHLENSTRFTQTGLSSSCFKTNERFDTPNGV